MGIRRRVALEPTPEGGCDAALDVHAAGARISAEQSSSSTQQQSCAHLCVLWLWLYTIALITPAAEMRAMEAGRRRVSLIQDSPGCDWDAGTAA